MKGDFLRRTSNNWSGVSIGKVAERVRAVYLFGCELLDEFSIHGIYFSNNFCTRISKDSNLRSKLNI